MKYLHIILIIFTISFVSACADSSTPTPLPRPTLPNPIPTQPPEAVPTEAVKRLESQPSLDAPIIAYNEIKEGTLNEPAGADEWVFNAKAGERINIVVNSQFDSYLELFDPDGSLVDSNDDRGDSLNAAMFDLQLKKTGLHAIIVRSYRTTAGNGNAGSYVLALTGGHPTVGGGLLTGGEPRNIVLSEQGFKWLYQGKQGSYLTIAVQGEQGVDSYLSIYGPDGALLISDDDSGGNLNPEIVDFELPADGLYTIRAHTIANTGLVTINLEDNTQVSGGGTLALGKSQLGTLKPGQYHRWNFTGEAGQVINLSLISPNFDTFLELRDSQDVILAENDDGPDGTNAVISTFALPVNDTYTIIARSLSNEEGGDYEITLKEVKVVPGGGSLLLDKPAQVSLAPGQIDVWNFDAEADTFATVRIQSNQVDTYLELFDPNGELLIGDDDSGGGLNAAILDFPIPEDGEYQAVVKSAREEENQGGVYNIELTVTSDISSTGQLEAGQSFDRELKAGEQHTWTFEAEEDAFVTVQMNSETLDTYLSLYDEKGELLYINDDFIAKQAALNNFIVPKDGEYRIIARAYSPEEEGTYTISLAISDEKIPVTTLPENQSEEKGDQ